MMESTGVNESRIRGERMRRVRCERVNTSIDSKPALAVQTAAPSLGIS
jgi:hypothetical protein